MAKKKEFDNIVEESFNEGYQSEPTINHQQIPPQETSSSEQSSLTSSKLPTENELLLRKILAGDESIIEEMLNHTDRSTYFLTDLQRACIEVKAREDVITKQEVVRAALDKYFDEETVAAAKDELIRKKIKQLEKEIMKENKEVK